MTAQITAHLDGPVFNFDGLDTEKLFKNISVTDVRQMDCLHETVYAVHLLQGPQAARRPHSA
eukprot:1141838-Pelagomonas_calceolata.AAC.5